MQRLMIGNTNEKNTHDIPKEYLECNGVLNEKGLAKYKSGASMDIIGKQIEKEEPEPRRVN